MPFPQPAKGNRSSGSPPPFRAKKTMPEEAPQNKNRLTGPPMQMGAGQGSMFANGRMGQPQGKNPPTPSYPQTPARSGQGTPQGTMPRRTPNYPAAGTQGGHGQAQGAHPRGVPTATMMANGGIGSPAPVGGGMPSDPDMDGDVDQDMSQGPQGGGAPMPAVKPEAVNYHDSAQNCSTCQFMDEGNNCSVLQMQVNPDGGCTAYEAGGGDQDMDQGMPTGADFTQNDDGTSGGPSLG